MDGGMVAEGNEAADLYERVWSCPNQPNVPCSLVYSEFDPWRETGVSATGRPGGPMKSTPETPVLVIPGGFHTSDLRVSNGQANEGVMDVIDAQVAQIKAWVDEYYE